MPERQEESEWIANNLYEFHKQVCLLFRTICEYCTHDTCPQMTAAKFQYWWSSGPQMMPVQQTASQYINHLLDWVQDQLDDEQTFPTRPSAPFPRNFRDICIKIATRLLRVYAHIYHHHLNRIKQLNVEAHMNTGLKHFIYFVTEFKLIEPKDLEPLKDWIVMMFPNEYPRLFNKPN